MEAEDWNSSSLQRGSVLSIINNAMLIARWAVQIAAGFCSGRLILEQGLTHASTYALAVCCASLCSQLVLEGFAQ